MACSGCAARREALRRIVARVLARPAGVAHPGKAAPAVLVVRLEVKR